MAHGRRMEAMLLTPHPSGFPQGLCVSGSARLRVCACVLVSLKQYSRPPCARNTTGCRSESLERGLPLNEFPVHPGVTHEYTPPLPFTPTTQPTHKHAGLCVLLLLRPCPPSCLINNAFSRQGCAATPSPHTSLALPHTGVLRTGYHQTGS